MHSPPSKISNYKSRLIALHYHHTVILSRFPINVQARLSSVIFALLSFACIFWIDKVFKLQGFKINIIGIISLTSFLWSKLQQCKGFDPNDFDPWYQFPFWSLMKVRINLSQVRESVWPNCDRKWQKRTEDNLQHVFAQIVKMYLSELTNVFVQSVMKVRVNLS